MKEVYLRIQSQVYIFTSSAVEVQRYTYYVYLRSFGSSKALFLKVKISAGISPKIFLTMDITQTKAI